MAKLLPPPNANQDVNSRQWKDWLYSVFALINGQGGVLGTMSAQNANSVAITGGSIGGVGITGSTINGTSVGALNPSTGAFTSLNSSSGALNGSIGVTTPNAGYFTTTLQRNGYTVKPNCYIEAYDLSASIAVNTTPTLLIPANTLSGATGISYNNTTGVFTFSQEGDYSLSLLVNALSTSGNRILYIYAEKNTGSGWVVNANSGKVFNLTSTQTTQIVYANSVHRVAGEQTRYWIYCNNTNVTLQTQTLPSVTGVYVPAIRIQYS
jgi:hypothetical protein